MSTEVVLSAVRRSNRNLLLLSLAGLALVVAGAAVGARYLYNFFLGPFPIERAALNNLTNAGGRLQYFVTVDGDDHADTGYQYVSRNEDAGRETIEVYYHALLLVERLLLVKTPAVEIGNTATGALADMPSDVQAEVITELERELPELTGAFLPMRLDAGDFRMNGYFGLGAAALIMALAAVGVFLAVRRGLDLATHPILKALERFGPAQAVAAEIDQEMAQPHEQAGKHAHVTRGWLVYAAGRTLQAARLRDVIWYYKHVTLHRTYGIPVRKTFAAQVWDRHGRSLLVPGSEAEVSTLLEMVARRAPGAIGGYSADLNQAWQKDRANPIAAVDARRAQASDSSH